jgi:hypothetical protein
MSWPGTDQDIVFFKKCSRLWVLPLMIFLKGEKNLKGTTGKNGEE